jgi:uroporphyrinogen III methyltransferase/synthase
MGKVYLVGAGPGDPGLLTIKARDLISAADCVVYDYLVNPEMLAHAKPRAELIYAGKRCGKCAMKQEEINHLLVAKASEHPMVVRLKGGDPFVFGRGGEEAEALTDAGVEWEIVPGVTAGAAVAAYAGIPLTHRGLSRSVAFVTGHEDPNKDSPLTNWEQLALGVDTLVLFMSVNRIGEIAERLIRHGRRPGTPVAVICRGTYDSQQTHESTLAEVGQLVARRHLRPPAIIVVGEVVRLRERLQWFVEDILAAAGD